MQREQLVQAPAAPARLGQPLAGLQQRLLQHQQQQHRVGVAVRMQEQDNEEAELTTEGLEGRLMLLLAMLLLSAMAASTAAILAPLIAGVSLICTLAFNHMRQQGKGAVI